MTYYNPLRQCADKRRYPNKRSAKAEAKQLEAIFGTRLRAYHCPWCATYHLGNPYRPDKSTAAETVNGPSVVASDLGPDQSERT